jgi:hypothetical protein
MTTPDPTHRHGYDEDDLYQWRMDQPGPATVLPGQLNLLDEDDDEGDE